MSTPSEVGRVARRVAAVPEVSVIIPTWRRPLALQRALQSLQTQHLEAFEIIVVDNACDEATSAVVRTFNDSAQTPATYVTEPELGLHNARHRGARAAQAELLVFTDDDATFDPRWLNSYRDAFRDNAALVAASGPVGPVWETEPPAWLTAYVARCMAHAKLCPALSLMDLGDAPRASPNEILFGVNLAIRKHTLYELGGFNPESFGAEWLGDGETGLNRRLRESGRLIGYVPTARVMHHIPPERMTTQYLVRRMVNEGATVAYAECRGRPVRRAEILACAIVAAVAALPFWVGGVVLRGQTGAFGLRVQLAAAWRRGRLRYLARLLSDAPLRHMVEQVRWIND